MAHTHPGTALVTGASSGIGALYADRLAQRGYDLILVARNRERLNALANTISTRSGRAVEVLPADLGDRAALARVEDLLREDASITLLVNNAGIGTHTPLLQSDVEQMTRMVDLNVTAPMRLAYAVAPAFVARGRGAIINIASIVAIAPELLNGVYGGSKASCWRSASRCGTNWPPPAQVQAVLPGATATDFWAIGGRPVENLDPRIVMRAEDLVDAALLGFERGEAVTIPSLHAGEKWDAYDAARLAMAGQLSSNTVAPRYAAAR